MSRYPTQPWLTLETLGNPKFPAIFAYHLTIHSRHELRLIHATSIHLGCECGSRRWLNRHRGGPENEHLATWKIWWLMVGRSLLSLLHFKRTCYFFQGWYVFETFFVPCRWFEGRLFFIWHEGNLVILRELTHFVVAPWNQTAKKFAGKM